jgi:uncharacterized protein (TIGR00255 family)
MIKSMTAFGRAEKKVDGRTHTAEIRTLNGRYLEISVRAPRQLMPIEERVRKLAATRISRGRVDVFIRVKNGSEAVSEIEVNLPLAKAYHKALLELNEALEIDEKVGLLTLLGFERIVVATEPEADLERTWATLSSCMGEALEGVDAMRMSEGKAIYRDFQKRLQSVEEGLFQIKELVPTVLAEYHNRLNERMAVLTERKIELDPNRLAQEAAFLVDKGDITEEIVRAQSHLKQFRSMIESEGPAGRALDFLLQELNREVNTIGSKGGDAQIAHMVVSLKSELEKIREQVQNIE